MMVSMSDESRHTRSTDRCGSPCAWCTQSGLGQWPRAFVRDEERRLPSGDRGIESFVKNSGPLTWRSAGSDALCSLALVYSCFCNSFVYLFDYTKVLRFYCNTYSLMLHKCYKSGIVRDSVTVIVLFQEEDEWA